MKKLTKKDFLMTKWRVTPSQSIILINKAIELKAHPHVPKILYSVAQVFFDMPNRYASCYFDSLSTKEESDENFKSYKDHKEMIFGDWFNLETKEVNLTSRKIEIKIPFKTPTVNLMYSTFNGHRVKSKIARELSKEVQNIVDNSKTKQIDGKLFVQIDIYSNWHNKDGSIKKRDIANLEKFITDSIFSVLPNMDDRQIFKIEMNKIQSTEEYSLIKIEEIKCSMV